MIDLPAEPVLPRLKHWRSFGRREWRHVQNGVLGGLFGSVLPLLSFYVTYRVLSFTPAVLVMLTWAAAAFAWHYLRRRRTDIFSLTTFAFACTKAAAGLASQSLSLYLVWPSVENAMYIVLLLGSALAGRPLLSLYAERLYPVPPAVRRSAQFRRVFLNLSWVWALGNAVRGLSRPILVGALPLERYLVADAVLGWLIAGALVAFTVWYPLRVLPIERAHGADAR